MCVDGKERVTKMLNDTRQVPPGHLCGTFYDLSWMEKKFLKVWNYKAACVLTGSLEIFNINVFMSCRATLTWPYTYKLDFLTCFQASKVRPAYRVTFYLFWANITWIPQSCPSNSYSLDTRHSLPPFSICNIHTQNIFVISLPNFDKAFCVKFAVTSLDGGICWMSKCLLFTANICFLFPK